MNNELMYYTLGKIDTMAEILALARTKEYDIIDSRFGIKIMKEIAKNLSIRDPENPHAIWWLNQ